MSESSGAEPQAISGRTLERALRMMKGEILEGRPDPEGLRALAEACFPGEDVSDPRYLRWLYEENPAGPATELVTKSGDLVTGHISGVPIRYRISGADALGGLAVRARLGLGHVDRSPLGDLAGTLAGVVASNPGIEIRARLARGDRAVNVSSTGTDGAAVSPKRGTGGAARAAARRLRQRIDEGIAALGMRG